MARFSDIQLIQILQKAARRVNRELCLFDTNDEISIDNSGGITPTDGTLEDLVIMLAECLISQRDYSSDLSVGNIGIAVRDGEQSIDTKQKASARSDFFNSNFSPCAEYRKQIVIEKLKRQNAFDIW